MNHMLVWYSPVSPFLLWLILVLFPCFSPAQQVPNETTARERTLIASSYTAERLWMWQRRLNLQGWDVSIAMCRASELKPKTLGNIHWELDKKSAVIHVLDPADYKMS